MKFILLVLFITYLNAELNCKFNEAKTESKCFNESGRHFLTKKYRTDVLFETIFYHPGGGYIISFIRDNKVHGLQKFYTKDHQLISDVNMFNGKIDGDITRYNTDGSVLMIIHYLKGKLKSLELFSDDHRLRLFVTSNDNKYILDENNKTIKYSYELINKHFSNRLLLDKFY